MLAAIGEQVSVSSSQYQNSKCPELPAKETAAEIRCSGEINSLMALLQGCKRDRDIQFLVRDKTETMSDLCHKTRPRPCKAKTETFFETFNLPVSMSNLENVSCSVRRVHDY